MLPKGNMMLREGSGLEISPQGSMRGRVGEEAMGRTLSRQFDSRKRSPPHPLSPSAIHSSLPIPTQGATGNSKHAASRSLRTSK